MKNNFYFHLHLHSFTYKLIRTKFRSPCDLHAYTQLKFKCYFLGFFGAVKKLDMLFIPFVLTFASDF